MRISEETINSVRQVASITEVIGHYIQLIKKGKGYSAICPFHDDHDPSLSISEDKQIYKCFVCGNGGNVFTFVQNYKKISFPESVVEVSKVIGKPIEVEYEAPKKVSKYQKEYDLLDTMIKYSNYLLTATENGKQAKQYLLNRGLEDNVISNFEIGYNPKNNVIYKYLNSKGYKDEDLINVNVARMASDGMHDIFYNRILFPIHNSFGNPIGFTARTLDSENTSKYINTAETILYTKGDIVYNYHRVKDSIKKDGYVIVVEGVMDVIAYFRADVYNVVATLGTACTKNQLSLLKSLSKNIVLGYDGDNPGINANLKLGELALKEGINVQVIDNDTELDPDEIITKYSKNALKDLASKRLSYIDYCFKQYKKKINLDNYSDRKEYHEKMLSIINLLTDQDDIENYLNTLTDITKIRKRPINQDKKEYNNYVIPKEDYSLDGLTKAEYIILVEMSMSYNGTSIFQKELGCLLDSTNQELASLIIDDYRKHEKCQLSRLYDEVKNPKVKELIATLGTIESLPNSFDEKILLGAIDREKIELKKIRLEELKSLISKNQTVDKDTANKYLEEYTNLLIDLKNSYGEKV